MTTGQLKLKPPTLRHGYENSWDFWKKIRVGKKLGENLEKVKNRAEGAKNFWGFWRQKREKVVFFCPTLDLKKHKVKTWGKFSVKKSQKIRVGEKIGQILTVRGGGLTLIARYTLYKWSSSNPYRIWKNFIFLKFSKKIPENIFKTTFWNCLKKVFDEKN